MAVLADLYRRKQEEKEEPQWWQKPFQWANDTPIVGDVMRGVGTGLEFIDKTWASAAAAPWTGDKSVAGNWWDYVSSGGLLNPTNWSKERKEYKEWESPKYFKGALELANPAYLVSGAGALKAVGAGSKALGATRLATGLGKASAAVGAVEALPGRAVGKIAGKAFEVLPQAERTLLRRTPQLADDFIASGAYNIEQETFIRNYFAKSAEEAITGDVTQIGAKLPVGLSTRDLSNITDTIAKEFNRIDPARGIATGSKVQPYVVTKFRNALEQARGKLTEKQALMSAERGQRTAAAEAASRGIKDSALAKAEFEKQLSGRFAASDMTVGEGGWGWTGLTDTEGKELLDHVWNFKYTRKPFKKAGGVPYYKKTAYDALEKLSLEGRVPTKEELRLLDEALGDGVSKAMVELQKTGQLSKFMDIANLPRAVLASWDMSAPFRQGMILHSRMLTSGRFKDLGKLYKDMFKAFGTEKWALEADDILRNSKFYEDWIANGGYHSPLVHGSLANREEQFLSEFASKHIPMVRRSERAYQTFLNQIRYKQYEHTVSMWGRSGISATLIEESKPALNRLINAASGRGQLNQVLEGNLGAALNATLFSPRLLISRIQFPLYYLDRRVPNLVRKEAAKELTSFLGVGAGILGMAAVAGAKVELDPRSSDFGKIQIGNTRHDIWAGYAQFSRLAAQLATAQRKDAFGEMSEQNRLDAVFRFIQSKTSPGTGLAIDLLKGQDYMGNELSLKGADLSKQFKQRVIPLFVQDMADAIYEQGTVAGSAIVAPAFFGVGTQTYGNEGVEARDTLTEQFNLSPDVWKMDEINEAKDMLKPYYAITEQAWEPYPELEAIAEQIRVLERTNPPLAKQILYRYPQIMQIRKQITMARKTMLRQNPQIKQALSIVNR